VRGLVDRPDPVVVWRELGARQEALIERLAGKREIHLVGPDTDITFSVAGRTWISDDGHKNMPGGEIFTGPVEDSANGTIRHTYPAVYGGKEVADVRLRFEGGRVVEASAGRNDELLQSLLGMDDGARRLGEFAFGTNPGVTRFTRNVLFDEKIVGTVHLALGAGYPSTGSDNGSALHRDMGSDLRQSGEIWVDGELFARAGQFLHRGHESVLDPQSRARQRLSHRRVRRAAVGRAPEPRDRTTYLRSASSNSSPGHPRPIISPCGSGIPMAA